MPAENEPQRFDQLIAVVKHRLAQPPVLLPGVCELTHQARMTPSDSIAVSNELVAAEFASAARGDHSRSPRIPPSSCTRIHSSRAFPPRRVPIFSRTATTCLRSRGRLLQNMHMGLSSTSYTWAWCPQAMR